MIPVALASRLDDTCSDAPGGATGDDKAKRDMALFVPPERECREPDHDELELCLDLVVRLVGVAVDLRAVCAEVAAPTQPVLRETLMSGPVPQPWGRIASIVPARKR